MIEGLLIAQLLATFLRGRGPFPLLRKACASLFASPPTAESRMMPAYPLLLRRAADILSTVQNI